MDILDFFWTFYLNHLSPLWGYFYLSVCLNIYYRQQGKVILAEASVCPPGGGGGLGGRRPLSWTEIPHTQRDHPSLDRDPGQRLALDRDYPWTETPSSSRQRPPDTDI